MNRRYSGQNQGLRGSQVTAASVKEERRSPRVDGIARVLQFEIRLVMLFGARQEV